MDYSGIELEITDLMQKINDKNTCRFRETYEKNRKFLNNYKFWRESPLPPFEKLKYKTKISFNSGGGVRFTLQNENYDLKPTKRPTKAFFRDMKKPILAKNELNICHYKYLCDNVRKSEDFGGDNHIYLYVL